MKKSEMIKGLLFWTLGAVIAARFISATCHYPERDRVSIILSIVCMVIFGVYALVDRLGRHK